MEEKQKVQVVFEFDRSEYDAYLFLMNPDAETGHRYIRLGTNQ